MPSPGYIGVSPADRDPTVSDDSVTTAKIQDAAVTAAKFATTGTALTTTFLRGDMAWTANAGGDVVGPASSTDDALAKFDSTTGKIIQNSTATLSDAGTLTATAFSGPLTGNVTGNASGTAATVTGATQSSITALGTIASLVATTADINAGTFDGIVGGTTPAAGTFTTLIGTNVDGIIGANTPAAITGTQVDITAQGDLRLQDTTGGQYVGFQAAGTTTTYTITMPAAAAASNGQALTTTTAGVGSWSTVGDASLASDQTWTGSQRGTLVTDNDGSFDQDGGNNFFCTPAGNITLTFTNHTSGQSGYILFVNSGHTISLAATTKGDANLGATLSTAGTYLVSYLDNGTNAYLTTSAVFA